ncbi:MAG: acyl carrier protein [Chloroflexi bacterium]|nr:acyl carrier protein [Chloroflexota bacterium]MBI3733657.1 acyl carrier protein [Chloroflexota bacterium]
MTIKEIEQAVAQYILKECLPGARPEELTSATPLITGGIIDSLGALNLALFLEDQFKIELQGHEVSKDYLNTTASIANLVHSKL